MGILLSIISILKNAAYYAAPLLKYKHKEVSLCSKNRCETSVI